MIGIGPALTKFTGREEDFPQWWLGFYTHATVLDVSEALEKDFDLPIICSGDALNDDEIDKVKKNAKVVMQFN